MPKLLTKIKAEFITIIIAEILAFVLQNLPHGPCLNIEYHHYGQAYGWGHSVS